ncbi:MAG TPA: PilZ domain-containing protein [Kiloniellaceae bacterium]|nr:PilZ domain-containing protein [Kiloniellaceae bacterium]
MLRTPIPNADERREWPRYRAAPKIELFVEANGQRHRCALENLSLGGACLSFPGNDMPSKAKFRLSLPDIGLVRMERRWRDGELLGVLFDYSDASLAFVQDCLRRIMTTGDEMAQAEP